MKNKLIVISDKELISSAYQSYLVDESHLMGDIPNKIYFPKNTRQVSQVIKEISLRNEKTSISGSRTGITGGSVPRNTENHISLDKISTTPFVEFNEQQECWTLSVSAGTTLKEIQEILSRKQYSCEQKPPGNLYFPVDPTETSASIGGMTACNASGARSYFYGPTRNWVTGLSVVLANGNILHLLRGNIFASDNKLCIDGQEIILPKINIPKTKHVAGYYIKSDMDIIDLFIGGEGTLGIITEVTLRLTQPPENCLYLCCYIPRASSIGFILDAIKSEKISPLAIEYMDHNSIEMLLAYRKQIGEASGVPALPETVDEVVYLEIGYSHSADFNTISEEVNALLIKHHSNIKQTWAGFSNQDLRAMKAFRHALPERINSMMAAYKKTIPSLTKISTDIAVPYTGFREMITYYQNELDKTGLQYCIFGHGGDCHVHVNILPKTELELSKAWDVYTLFARKAVTLQGSIAAEHGIGVLKKKYMIFQYTAEELQAMKNLKESLDPKTLLNPHVLFD